MSSKEQLLEIARLGINIIPLEKAGKRPFIRNWPDQASRDEAKISDWAEQYPEHNWGIVLGSDSGIIDIECDDEQAEATLIELFDGEIPVTAMYSASRGNHRLFRFRRDLPSTAVMKIGALEFRIGSGGAAAQSVIPPSTHPSGAQYQWVNHCTPEEVGFAELRDDVVEKILQHYNSGRGSGKRRDWADIARGVPAGQRAESATQYIGKLLSAINDPFDNDLVNLMYTQVDVWNSQNDPPLDDAELETTFDSILRRERNQRNSDDFAEPVSRQVALSHQADEVPKGWHLQIIMGNPKIFHLYSPMWSGYLELNSVQMTSARQIEIQALEQKTVLLPKQFTKLWAGDRRQEGLSRRLVDAADKVAADIEDDRELVIAQLVSERVEAAHDLREGRKPDGTMQRLDDGSIVFKFGWLLEQLRFHHEKVERRELSKLLQKVKATEYTQRRLKRLAGDSLGKLKSLID